MKGVVQVSFSSLGSGTTAGMTGALWAAVSGTAGRPGSLRMIGARVWIRGGQQAGEGQQQGPRWWQGLARRAPAANKKEEQLPQRGLSGDDYNNRHHSRDNSKSESRSRL